VDQYINCIEVVHEYSRAMYSSGVFINLDSKKIQVDLYESYRHACDELTYIFWNNLEILESNSNVFLFDDWVADMCRKAFGQNNLNEERRIELVNLAIIIVYANFLTYVLDFDSSSEAANEFTFNLNKSMNVTFM